jgi:class 3 adenylate cyclase
MNLPVSRPRRLEPLIEAMDRPLLVLALATMALYLLDLRGYLGAARPAYEVLTVVIDFVFVFDLVVKIRALGRDYLRTPWFLIDFLSCLPVLDVLSSGTLPVRLSLRAIRFVRVFRILRILRTLRVLRALRTIPAFDAFLKEAPATESNKRFQRNMNVAMLVLTLTVLGLIVAVRSRAESEYFRQVNAALQGGSALTYLESLGGRLEPPPGGNYVRRTLMTDGREVTLYFDLSEVDARTDEVEFFLVVGMIITMLFFMYIMAYHQFDVTQTQMRALLNLALPSQLAERFVTDPRAYEERSRSPGTVLFMDFAGFTHTCEALAHDPDKLSAHLERAMDRLVCELARHDLIIDKFIGDAVMSFRGGPLVSGGLPDHAYRAVRAALDSIKALDDLDDPYFRQVKIGGASSDDCLIGAFGTSARLSYTILGDTTNVAARLEPACAQCQTQNLFCETTYRLCAQRPDIVWRRWGRIRVAGRDAPLTVYEAFDAGDQPDWSFVATYERALEAFERKDFDRARELFLLADSQRPGGDGPSRGYAGWCESLILEGAAVGWQPVFETHK